MIAACAQGLDTDSLKTVLTKTKEETSRILILSQLCNELARYDPDTAIRLAQDGLKVAKQINYLNGEARLALALAIALSNVGDYLNSIKWASSYLKYADTTRDIQLKSMYYGEISVIYREQGDYDEALKYSDKVISFTEKALKSLPQDPCNFCRAIYAVRAGIYMDKNQLDFAKKYIDKALSYPLTPLKAINASAFNTAGQIQERLKNYDPALQLYRQSAQAFLELKHPYRGLPRVYNSISTVFATMGIRDSAFYDSAFYYLYKSLAISQPKNFAREALETELLLSKMHESINPDSALYYYKRAMDARETLFNQDKQRQLSGYKFNLELQQQQAENAQVQVRSRIKIYALLALALTFLILGAILWRNNARRKKSYILLQRQKAETDYQKDKAERTLEELKATQAQLIQSEKMASLGELTAGIAHEIQNPLNFVNNFSEVNSELINEMLDEAGKGNAEEVKAIAHDIKQNLEKINHHGKRADAIVKGMLQHSRASAGQKELTDINALTDEYLRLSYHGMRAKDKSFNVTLYTHLDPSIGMINIVPQEIGRALLNLYNNAFYAVGEKEKQQLKAHLPTGQEGGQRYEPTVTVSTEKHNGRVEIKVKDNGTGIPQKIADKIFQPFFTTKPTGQGTGLGLSLAYDIVKAHSGELKVETKEARPDDPVGRAEGSEFVIQLPATSNIP